MKNIVLVGLHVTLTQDKFGTNMHQSQVPIALHFHKPFVSTLTLFQEHYQA